MSRQNEHDAASSAHYEGKFAAKKAKKAHKLSKAPRVLLTVLAILLGLIVLLGAAAFILHESGRRKLLNPDTVVSFPSGEDTDKSVIVQKDNGDRISYQGHTYELNRNLTTFLFMGIDKTVSDGPSVPGQSGQADVILVIALDSETGVAKILCFPRDTYAEVDIYSVEGSYMRTDNAQLCLAYGYGDGLERSCENMITSVERFLYGIPINSYIALDMNGILLANDSVGGITVKALTDFTFFDGQTVRQGEETTLLGQHAEAYIRSRSETQIDANVARMARQKQYVQAFASTVIRQAKGNPASLISLYQLLDDYMVTDLTLDKVAFLAPIALKNGGEFTFRTVQTEKIELVGKYPMYYLDENDLQDAVISTFYTQID